MASELDRRNAGTALWPDQTAEIVKSIGLLAFDKDGFAAMKMECVAGASINVGSIFPDPLEAAKEAAGTAVDKAKQ